MNILALETATDACSVALSINGETRQRFQIAPQRHTELLLPMVGAFTGVRVATALALGLAFAFELPVLGVSTLAALALGGYRASGVRDWLVMQDARRSELYWAHYAIDPLHHEAQLVAPETVSAPAAVVLPAGQAWDVVGSGWAIYAEQTSTSAGLPAASRLLWPEAQDLIPQAIRGLKAGLQQRPETLAPVYLRPAV